MANPNPSPATRFKPGAEWRGNGNGRLKGPSVTARLRRLLESIEADGKQKADLLAEAILAEAMDGNAQLIREVLDRTEGKVPLRIAGADGEDLSVKHYHVSNAPDDL